MAGESYNGINFDFALARYDTNGNLDPLFGTSGRVTTDFLVGDFDEFGNDIAIQPDGKLVVAGAVPFGGTLGLGVARYNPNGSLDTSFGIGGKIINGIGGATAIVIQPDAKFVLVAGNRLARYNSDGTLDNNFGIDGLVTIINMACPRALSIQADGKMVVAGGCSPNDFVLVRRNSDGSVDNGFGINGTVITDFGGAENPLAMVNQADGKIVVAGGAVLDNLGVEFFFALARYLGDSISPFLSANPGSLDFAAVPVGTTKDLSFTVQNTGGGTLTGSATASAPFSIVGNNSFSLAANQSQLITVRFSPSSVGIFNDVLVVNSNAGNLNVPIAGIGLIPDTNPNPPRITEISPRAGVTGDTITILGRNFGPVSGGISIGSTLVSTLTWNDTFIQFLLPDLAPRRYTLQLTTSTFRTARPNRRSEQQERERAE